MKFVKRISLFFIYPLTMYSLGFVSSMMIDEFFYPGNYSAKTEVNPVTEENDSEVIQEPLPLEVAVLQEPVITADTRYVVVDYDIVTDTISQQEEVTPDKYIGLDREELEEALKEYEESPSLTDLEKGFESIELLSFSADKIVIRKNFEKPAGYFLINENHNVVVYDKSLKHLYMDTGIQTQDLPKELQDEIMQMKYIEDEMELYHFLESYSS